MTRKGCFFAAVAAASAMLVLFAVPASTQDKPANAASAQPAKKPSVKDRFKPKVKPKGGE